MTLREVAAHLCVISDTIRRAVGGAEAATSPALLDLGNRVGYVGRISLEPAKLFQGSRKEGRDVSGRLAVQPLCLD
jgi:hypothetical protein